MTSPIAIQPKRRHQLAVGSDSIKTKQQRIPKTGTTGTQGQRKGRSAWGFVRRMTRTAAQTMEKANKVPMLVIWRSALMGRKPVAIATKAPINMVFFHGV